MNQAHLDRMILRIHYQVQVSSRLTWSRCLSVLKSLIALILKASDYTLKQRLFQTAEVKLKPEQTGWMKSWGSGSGSHLNSAATGRNPQIWSKGLLCFQILSVVCSRRNSLSSSTGFGWLFFFPLLTLASLPTANGQPHRGISQPKLALWPRARLGKESLFVFCVSSLTLHSLCSISISTAAHVAVFVHIH